MKKYSIGGDFGSLSERAILVDLTNGEEIVIFTFNYPNLVNAGGIKLFL